MKIIKKTISASAPGKLILMGEHSVVYGHPAIITAVNHCIEVAVSEQIGQSEHLKKSGQSVDVRDVIVAPQVKKPHFVEETLKFFREKYQDRHAIQSVIKLETHAQFSDQDGLGSSSAVTVATCKALSEFFGIGMSDRDIFDLSFKAVLNIQGSASGADIAVAVYGGTLYYKDRGSIIEKISGENICLVIGNSGEKAPTIELIQRVARLMKHEPEKVNDIFHNITELVEKGRTVILHNDLQNLGKLMTENHQLLCELGVCTEKLNALVAASMHAGALGAKLSGAGGGDNMFALVTEETKQTVEKAIEQAGGRVIHVETNYALI